MEYSRNMVLRFSFFLLATLPGLAASAELRGPVTKVMVPKEARLSWKKTSIDKLDEMSGKEVVFESATCIKPVGGYHEKVSLAEDTKVSSSKFSILQIHEFCLGVLLKYKMKQAFSDKLVVDFPITPDQVKSYGKPLVSLYSLAAPRAISQFDEDKNPEVVPWDQRFGTLQGSHVHKHLFGDDEAVKVELKEAFDVMCKFDGESKFLYSDEYIRKDPIPDRKSVEISGAEFSVAYNYDANALENTNEEVCRDEELNFNLNSRFPGKVIIIIIIVIALAGAAGFYLLCYKEHVEESCTSISLELEEHDNDNGRLEESRSSCEPNV